VTGRRWLLALYPRDRRAEVEAVLAQGIADGRWRPGVAASLDLLAGALRRRAAIRLMRLGALVELGTLVTIAASAGSVKAALLRHDPRYGAAQWHAEVHGRIVGLEVSATIAIAVWLVLAWANSRDRPWARIAFAAFFALTTVGLSNGVSRGAAAYAPADLVAGSALWLVAAATTVALFARG
jgi:hypothetical protein